MKRVLATFLAAFAAATFGATFAPKEYVDMMDESNRVSAVQYTDESIHTLSTNVILKGEKRVGVGAGAVVESNGGVAVGVNSVSSNLSSTAVGSMAEANGIYATAVGMQSKATGTDASAFGYKAQATKQSALALGATSVSTGNYSVAVGAASTARADYGIAIGHGAEAGNQSIAIGRDAKANHTAAVAIGPTAETTADNTMRIKYAPNEIYIGFFTPKTLTQTIIDTVGESPSAETVTNIVNDKIASANQFLRATDYGISGSTTQQVFSTSRSVSKLWGTWIASYTLSAPGSNSYRLEYGTNTNIRLRDNSGLSFSDSAKATFSSGTYAQFNNGAIVRIMNPDDLTFGPSGSSTNIAQLIEHAVTSDGIVSNLLEKAIGNYSTVSNRAMNAVVKQGQKVDVGSDGYISWGQGETRILTQGDSGWTFVFDDFGLLRLPITEGEHTVATTDEIPTTMAWGSITSKPTTVSGYGITDALKSDFVSLTNNTEFTSAVAAVSSSADTTSIEAKIETNRVAIATLSARAYIEVVSADEVYYVFTTNQE